MLDFLPFERELFAVRAPYRFELFFLAKVVSCPVRVCVYDYGIVGHFGKRAVELCVYSAARKFID